MTAGIVSNPFCSAGHGFDRGFDYFWDEIEGRGKEGEHVNAAATGWLDDQRPGQPFFLIVAYMDAHTPYISEAIPPSLEIEINGRSCCRLRAENAHVEQKIALRLSPGENEVEFIYLRDSQPAKPEEARSSLRLENLRSVDLRFEIRPTRGWEKAQEPRPHLIMANRATIEIANPTGAETETTLAFRYHRLYEESEIPAYYLEGTRSVDRQFGALVKALKERGLWEDLVVVFVSDHGEMLGENSAWVM